MKGKVHRKVVSPALAYGLEAVALTRRQEAALEEPKQKM